MKHFWLYVAGLCGGVALSLIMVQHAKAQGDVPPPMPTDCQPAVANQFSAVDDSGADASSVPDDFMLVRWGDADGDGNAGDQIIIRIVDTPGGGRQLIREVNLAQWTTTCQMQGTCTDDSGDEGCNDGDSGGGGSGGGDGDCTEPCPGGMTGPNGECAQPTPCPGGMGPNGEPCAPETAPNPPPSYVINPEIDAPPQCAFIEVTEYGMKCYPTCSGSTTEGGVACLGVQREPYPRGLVGVPNVYIVLGPYSKEGSTATCPDPSLEKPLYRNRTLQVLWEMDMTIPPAWFFDERPWNVQKGVSNQAFGFEVEHTFETSSYSTHEGDKPNIGPSTTNELLPAYLVRLDTWWLGYVKREWDEYYWHEEYEDVSCTYNPGAPNHDPACNPNGRKSVMKPGFPEYRFRGHMVSKDQIDLRTWGWPTSKLYSRSGWDPRQSVAGIPPQYLCRYIPTPILESQAVTTTTGNP